MSIISELGRWRLENHEFKTTLGYTVRPQRKKGRRRIEKKREERRERERKGEMRGGEKGEGRKERVLGRKDSWIESESRKCERH